MAALNHAVVHAATDYDDARRVLLLERRRKILLARSRLLDFTQLLHPHPDFPDDAAKSTYEIGPPHPVIAKVLEDVAEGREKRVIIVCPPRIGKTELASKSFPAWFGGKFPDKSLIAATYNEKYAWDLGRAVRDNFRHPAFNQIFPDVTLKKQSQASDRLQTSRGGIIVFVGRGGTITGRGGDVLLLDDPIKNDKEAASLLIRDDMWNWYLRTVRSRLMTDRGAIVIITTRWNEDDLVGRLTDPNNLYYDEDEAKKWKIVHLRALAEDDDIIGRKVGEALWPTRFNEAYLEELRRTDARGFSALYQGDPAPQEGAFFNASSLNTYRRQDLPKNLRFYGASDHAVSTKQGGDRTCLLIFGIDEKDTIWILPEAFWERAATDVVVARMVDMIQRYKPLMWFTEKGPIAKSIGPFLRKRMSEKKAYCAIHEMTVDTDKMSRAQAVHGRMAMGGVMFPVFAPWFARAKHELLTFPNGANDDFVDALSCIGQGLMRTVHAKAVADTGKKSYARGTFGAIKQQSNEARRQSIMAQELRGW